MAKVALTPAQKVAAWRKRFAAADPEEQKKIHDKDIGFRFYLEEVEER